MVQSCVRTPPTAHYHSNLFLAYVWTIRCATFTDIFGRLCPHSDLCGLTGPFASPPPYSPAPCLCHLCSVCVCSSAGLTQWYVLSSLPLDHTWWALMGWVLVDQDIYSLKVEGTALIRTQHKVSSVLIWDVWFLMDENHCSDTTTTQACLGLGHYSNYVLVRANQPETTVSHLLFFSAHLFWCTCIFILNAGWYGDQWWTRRLPVVLDEKTNCTLEDMMRVLAYSLSVVQYPIVNESEVSQLGLVSILLEVTCCVRAARTYMYVLPEVYISILFLLTTSEHYVHSTLCPSHVSNRAS